MQRQIRFDTSHAMDCKMGGFVNARHDSIRDFETSLHRKVCTDIESEPHLLPITSEILLRRSANTSAEVVLTSGDVVFGAGGKMLSLTLG